MLWVIIQAGSGCSVGLRAKCGSRACVASRATGLSFGGIGGRDKAEYNRVLLPRSTVEPCCARYRVAGGQLVE